MAKPYGVTLPIAGHAYVTVEAENEKEAIEKAMEIVEVGDIEDWVPLEAFNTGNYCHCPDPWEAFAEEE